MNFKQFFIYYLGSRIIVKSIGNLIGYMIDRIRDGKGEKMYKGGNTIGFN